MRRSKKSLTFSAAILATAIGLSTGCQTGQSGNGQTFDPGNNQNECLYGPPPFEDTQEDVIIDDEQEDSTAEDVQKETTESMEIVDPDE